MIPYLSPEEIRKYGMETLREYERIRGRRIEFPIDPLDIFERLFGLAVIYDDRGILNQMGEGIIGCMYPDGHPSPWGRDKVIVINITKPSSGGDHKCSINDPTTRNENFTTAHEGFHYILHYLKGIMGEQYRRPIFCRSKDRYSPLEFQANAGSGELLMQLDKVIWLLDGKRPGEVILLDAYQERFKEFFGANQGMMERRLTYLGYKLLNAKYEWADYVTQMKKQEEEARKWIKNPEKSRKVRAEGDRFSRAFPASSNRSRNKFFKPFFNISNSFDFNKIFSNSSRKNRKDNFP